MTRLKPCLAIAIVLLVLAGSAGCAEDPRRAPAGPSEDVAFETDDGVQIRAAFYPAKGKGASSVILLHMLGGERASWKSFAELLQASGLCVLAPDFRGHGESTVRTGGGVIERRQFGQDDYRAMMLDVRAAAAWIGGKAECDSKQLALVGASIGANVALVYAAGSENVKGVVLLSPGRNYRGVEVVGAATGYRGRPAYLVATRGDLGGYCARTVEDLASLIGPSASARIEEGALHGIRMIGQVRGLESDLISWLKKTL